MYMCMVMDDKLNYNMSFLFTDVTFTKHKDETEQVIIQKMKYRLRLASTRVGNKLEGVYYHKSKLYFNV